MDFYLHFFYTGSIQKSSPLVFEGYVSDGGDVFARSPCTRPRIQLLRMIILFEGLAMILSSDCLKIFRSSDFK